MTEQKNRLKGTVFLFLASLIWGTAFVAQRVGMDYLGPFAFNASRNILGGIVLIPCIILLEKLRSRDGKENLSIQTDAAAGGLKGQKSKDRKTLLAGGFVCGFFLFIASNLQQIGIKYTTVGKAGFITALYIVLVPVLGIFLHRRIGLRMWISVILAVAGLYLLCINEEFSVSRGDAYVLMCALAFAFQIMAVDYFAERTDGVKLACLEFWVCGILSLILAAATETVTLQGIKGALIPILYAGVLSSGVAYTFQILGQKELNPSLASLIMSFESVISVLAGWLFLHQVLSLKELAGCAVMFAAIVLAQL